jgi:hypothetical protein
MSLARALVLSVVACAAAPLATACSGGTVNVGTQEQELRKKSDGGASGNGQTCSIDDATQYAIGETFKTPDGCNDCTCTKDGAMCTLRACAPACTEEAKQCPDGSYVSRTGPKCEFVCPPPTACTTEAKLCPDGKTYVSRTGPSCEFAPCP